MYIAPRAWRHGGASLAARLVPACPSHGRAGFEDVIATAIDLTTHSGAAKVEDRRWSLGTSWN